MMNEYITNRVHDLYWKEDINCARTALVCLSELFEITIEPQTIRSAVGLHGAGGYRAQCGLVEGTLMFIGIYLHGLGKSEDEIVAACYNFASAFEKAFGSLFFFFCFLVFVCFLPPSLHMPTLALSLQRT